MGFDGLDEGSEFGFVDGGVLEFGADAVEVGFDGGGEFGVVNDHGLILGEPSFAGGGIFEVDGFIGPDLGFENDLHFSLMGGVGGGGDAGVGLPGAFAAESDFRFASGGVSERDEGDTVDGVFGELVELGDGFGGFVADTAFGGEGDTAKEEGLGLQGSGEEEECEAHVRLRIR